MDGFDVRHVRSTEGIDETLVIATVSASIWKKRRKSLEAGCNAFLAKPLEEMLLEALPNTFTITVDASSERYRRATPLRKIFSFDQILAVRFA